MLCFARAVSTPHRHAIFAALLVCAFPTSLQAALTAKPSLARPSLTQLFQNAKQLFWSVEPQFNNYYNPITALPALEPGDADTSRYRAAAHAAEAFLVAADSAGLSLSDARRPVALYFAAMSFSSLSEHAKAIALIDRLLRDYPNYRRPRVEDQPEMARPVRADLLHLKLYHASRLTDFFKIKKPLEFLGDVAASGAEALNAARTLDSENDSDLSYSSPTPDQLRAAALPSPQSLVADIHNLLLPQAITNSGAKAVRDYLRGLMSDKGPFASYASFKLQGIDRVILAGYRDNAQKAWREKKWQAARAAFALIIKEYEGTTSGTQAEGELKQVIVAQYKDEAATAFAAKNFDSAKVSLRRILAEYAGSSDADWAEGELKKIVPVAVAYYKTEGDKNFRVGETDQFGKPQTKSREYFEKMYKEDPDGPQADYALYYWSRGLGTEGKPEKAMEQFEMLIKKFPDSALVPDAIFSQAFIFGAGWNKQYDKAVALMMSVVKSYPKSDRAPEALWYSAYMLAYSDAHNYDAATALLLQLRREYPNNVFTKNVDEELGRYRRWAKEGFLN